MARVRGSDPGLQCIVPDDFAVSGLDDNVCAPLTFCANWSYTGNAFRELRTRCTVASLAYEASVLGIVGDENSQVPGPDPIENLDVLTELQVQDSCGVWVTVLSQFWNTGS